MSQARRSLLTWIEQDLIPKGAIPEAIAIARIYPTKSAWRSFIDRLLLFVGVALLTSGVIFFFASNWQEVGRLAKFALVQLLIVTSLAFVWVQGVNRTGGKAALFTASLFLGTLLALVGQTYQTGADTFGLFATWAVMILPWVLIARAASLWLLWIALVNIAVVLYFNAIGSMFWSTLHTLERNALASFLLNAIALALWERFRSVGTSSDSGRWAPRLLIVVTGGFATVLAVAQIIDVRLSAAGTALVFPLWLALTYFVYRRRIRDIFAIAVGVLSVIVVIAALFGRQLGDLPAVGFLFSGVVVLALSAVGGLWLQRLSQEETK